MRLPRTLKNAVNWCLEPLQGLRAFRPNPPPLWGTLFGECARLTRPLPFVHEVNAVAVETVIPAIHVSRGRATVHSEKGIPMGPFTVRKEQRFRQSVPVQYRGAGITGEGLVYDLSLSGGRIVGNVPVSVGMSLVLRLSLPGDAEPFQFDQVTVRWVRGLEFGMDLGTPPPDVAERFTRVIAELVQKHHGSTS